MPDLILNMIAFGAVIATQQLALLPFISRHCDDAYFANLIMVFTVANTVCSVLGGELGNTRMLRHNAYEAMGAFGDFGFLLSCMVPVSAVVSAAAGVVVHIGAVDTSLFAAAAALGAVRLYAAACYRLEKMFLTLVGQSIAYVLGAILGMGALRYFPYYSLPFVAGEFAACVHFVIKLDRFPLSLTRTSALKATCAVFAQLGVLSLLTNLVMYADRLLLYPLLGHTAVAVYYAASAMSKISGLLTNPIASFLLSRLSLSDDASRPTIVLAAIKWTTVLVPVSLLGNLAVSYFSLVTLYPKYYDASVTLLLPVCGSAALTDCVVMLRTVLLRFHGSRSVLWIYAIYLAFFAVAGVCLSHFFGLWGFVAANLLARVFLWLSCVLVLYTHRLTHEQRPPGPNSP